MATKASFETITDWVTLLVMAFVLCVIYVGWLASYRTSKAAPVGTSIWFRLPQWGQIAAGLAISAVGAYSVYRLWTPIAIPVSPPVSFVLRVIGLGVVSVGASLFLWARKTLGAMYNASTSSAVQLQSNHHLIQHGPFAFVRHPIYLSYWIIPAGLFTMYRTWVLIVILLLMLISLTKRARREEQVLEAAFGDEWRNYARQVPRFIPQWRPIHYGQPS
jgi:protein-S-isoprenylcysteine O-methyltransferase Ste14